VAVCDSIATPGKWQCKTGGVRWLAVANGPKIFQMLLVYLTFISSVTVRVIIKVRVRVIGLGLGLIIPTCRANLVLRVIWQCDIFGMTPVLAASQRRQRMSKPWPQTTCIKSIIKVSQ